MFTHRSSARFSQHPALHPGALIPRKPVTLMVIVLLIASATPYIAPAAGAQSARNHQSGPQLGVWQPPAPGDFRPLVDLERSLGRHVDIVPWYQAWDSTSNSSFRSDEIQWVLDHGAIPMITWEPWNTKNGVNQSNFALSEIASGRHDRYIRNWAQAADRIDGPIYLRFAHEMNGSWYPWAASVNGNSAEDYVSAWIHIHDIFESAGATNVQWVWSPNRDYPGATPLDSLFPGDAYVDWVAIDGYNFGVEKAGTGTPGVWRSFNDTFKATYDILTGLSNRPVMIGETGSTEAGGDKADWIREGLNPENLATNFPRLEAVIWFNQVGSGNWPLSTSRSASEAFTEVVLSWNKAANGRDDREPDPAPPAAEPAGPLQPGRARITSSQNPRQLLGIWWRIR